MGLTALIGLAEVWKRVLRRLNREPITEGIASKTGVIMSVKIVANPNPQEMT